jgi:cation transport regulator ChaB
MKRKDSDISKPIPHYLMEWALEFFKAGYKAAQEQTQPRDSRTEETNGN